MNFQYMLAPMEDITGNAFRTLCYENGADLTFTELVRVDGLARSNKSTWSRLEFKDATPVVIQLLGAREQSFKKFLSMFKPSPGFKGFNLNLGCPSQKVINLGQGCAMIRRISKVRKIIAIFRDRGYPISVKMRLGVNDTDRKHKSYLNLIKAADADFFVVHARYANQTYAQPADSSVFEECAKLGKRIIANGDINTKEKVDLVKNAGVNGAMVGRYAVLDPSIFNKLKGRDCPKKEQLMKRYSELSDKYNEPFKYSKNFMKHFNKPDVMELTNV